MKKSRGLRLNYNSIKGTLTIKKTFYIDSTHFSFRLFVKILRFKTFSNLYAKFPFGISFSIYRWYYHDD